MDDPEFVTEVDTTTQEILLHASRHDLEALKPYLRVPGAASAQDPETGTTPLHAAIAACGSAKANGLNGSRVQSVQTNGDIKQHGEEEEDEEVDIEKAKAVVKELFLSGAIWNDLDKNNETPGCLAWRLGQKDLYDMIVETGVRAELLLNLMGGYEPLADNDEEEEEVEEDTTVDSEEVARTNESNADVKADTNGISDGETTTHETTANDSIPNPTDEITSTTYLSNTLSFPSTTTLLDASSNGVMMTWETPIMSRTVSLLCPPRTPSSTPSLGPRVLNIGFGLGIIDTLFSQLNPPPHTHHIIEAHPSILSLLSQPSTSHPPNTPEAFTTFGPDWQSQANNYLHHGRWQDILPLLVAPPPDSPWLDEQGQPPQFDAIFFDTFAEDYAALKEFFTEYVPGLLAEGLKMSFFMGCGADRRVCYDVYRRVVECDLGDAGLDVGWTEVEVPKGVWGNGDGRGEGEDEDVWRGVRRYFDVDVYYLPICESMG